MPVWVVFKNTTYNDSVVVVEVHTTYEGAMEAAQAGDHWIERKFLMTTILYTY